MQAIHHLHLHLTFIHHLGLQNAQARGALFIGPGVDVYEGMVVGSHQRSGDLAVNVCKKKQLTNMRNSIREIDERLTTPRQMSLDEEIEYLADDELLEVTPQSYRIRKRILNTDERNKRTKRIKKARQAQIRGTQSGERFPLAA